MSLKYQRKVFTSSMIERLREIVWELCQKWDCKMIEMDGEQNHIHLLFQYYPQLSLPKFVGDVKSVTSRRLRSEFTDATNRHYRKAVLWNERISLPVVVALR